MNIEIESIDTIDQAAQIFIDEIKERTLFAFNGKMVAGKTTFIKSICENMGVKETINSPTFSIVNEYEAANGQIIYHFDCYRINTVQEALDLGIEEYLYSNSLCFIEWSENIAPILPNSIVNVDIEVQEIGKRIVNIN
jgi:tRNA threonylcarbamoyladenosine biosynthesis protein TsaE